MSDITKWIIFSDIHFGLRNNEKRHNQECVEFVKWAISEAKAFGADHSIMGGDWHHYRNTLQSTTLNYSLAAFELLNNAFTKHWQIIGNHDLFFKDKRDVNSVEFARDLPNIVIVNKITKINEDITVVPWLVDNEYKKVAAIETPYIVGHFEFPFFLMNAMVAMPEVGKINADMFTKEKQHIFSGHFHKRQKQTNKHGAVIEYIGNCFPHSFSDAWDDDRGIMLLEIGKEPIYKAWTEAPKFRTLTLSKLLEDPSAYLDSKTNARVTIDAEISYEEANFIRDTMITEYNPRELNFIPFKEKIEDVQFDNSIVFESIDQIVIEQLTSIDSNTLDSGLLVDIYNGL